MVVILGEILNFTMMLSLVATSYDIPVEYMTTEERTFYLWVWTEIWAIIVTIGCNILYVMIRSCLKEVVKFEVNEDEREENMDFLSCESNQIFVNLLSKCFTPPMISIVYLFIKNPVFSIDPMTQTEKTVVRQQFILQLVQTVAFLYAFYAPTESKIKWF